ncbi:MAG TPA: type II secretion system protein [Elusimicrobiota bacterium]|nr:type II secretion system protein [Elusimicrobiota bacterium]
MRHRRPAVGGFTLIELMIVVAILSILALLVLPKFGALVQKSKEGSTKGHLGAVRGALRLYYMDNDQNYPPSFSALSPKYIGNAPPLLYTAQHPLSETVDDLPAMDPVSDAAHWGYVPAGQDAGHFWIQCTHTDTAGTPWSTH